FAFEQKWFTPEMAIQDGARWISENYVNHPTYKQNTLYKMRFNPDRPGVDSSRNRTFRMNARSTVID
ncbi:hypothetical protein ACW7EJ_12285, partial [Acinetobacter soli]